MLTVSPSIAPEIYRIAPGFRALSICVKAAPVLHPDAGEIALREACEAVLAGEPEWAESHLAAWADVFQKFGAKPKRTPCSADALRKRVLRDGTMPALDPIVDLYNAVSLRYAVPVGGENISAYQGSPRLAVANGTEPFDTVKEGETAVKYPSQGEVIWCDDTGATCRRWNWRQGDQNPRGRGRSANVVHSGKPAADAAGETARSREDADRRPGKNDARPVV